MTGRATRARKRLSGPWADFARLAETATDAAPTCELGACGFECNPGFADCNGDPADGCEVEIDADVANCGACGRDCGPIVVNGVAGCEESECTVVACLPDRPGQEGAIRVLRAGALAEQEIRSIAEARG